VMFFWIGLYPGPFLRTSELASKALVAKLEQLRFGRTNIVLPQLQTAPAVQPQKLLEELLRQRPPLPPENAPR
jgi:hypothetical protein